MPSERQRCGVAIHLDEQFTHNVVGAVPADHIAAVGVIDVKLITAHTGIHLAVAEDRDVEAVMRIGPDVEIRGIVLTQINAVGQCFCTACRPNEQVRSILGSVIGVLLPLVGNRRHDTLHIGQQI